jgi:hypothetical protein
MESLPFAAIGTAIDAPAAEVGLSRAYAATGVTSLSASPASSDSM